MNLGPVFIFPALTMVPLALCAQNQASLGVGAGVVRYAGGSSFSPFTLSPAGQLLSPAFFLGAAAGVSLLETGARAAQGRADLWAAFPHRTSGFRGAASATIAGSTRSDGVGSASGTAVLEALWNAAPAGQHGAGGVALGAGWVSGVIEGYSGVGALRLRARSWWQPDQSPSQFTFNVESTRFDSAWYTDFVGGWTLDQPRLTASLWASARVSSVYQSSAAASAAVQYFIKPAIAVEASGGNYLADPFQGLPRASFVSGGVRVYTGRHPTTTSGVSQATPALQPLIAQHRGDTVVVRFRMPGATAVAIAGSWNEWTPVALRGLGGGTDIWEAALLLQPGTYYFNLVVDGKEWVVPSGVAVVPDGMGGMMAVLTVL